MFSRITEHWSYALYFVMNDSIKPSLEFWFWSRMWRSVDSFDRGDKLSGLGNWEYFWVEEMNKK